MYILRFRLAQEADFLPYFDKHTCDQPTGLNRARYATCLLSACKIYRKYNVLLPRTINGWWVLPTKYYVDFQEVGFVSRRRITSCLLSACKIYRKYNVLLPRTKNGMVQQRYFSDTVTDRTTM